MLDRILLRDYHVFTRSTKTEGGEKMPEREKQIIDAISNVVGNMKKEDKVYILGYVEGMAAVKGTEPGDEENQEEVLV